MSYRTWEDLEDDEEMDALAQPVPLPNAPADLARLMDEHPRLAELARERELLERRMAELSGTAAEAQPLRPIANEVPTMAERRADYARWEQRHDSAKEAMRLARREMDYVDRRWLALRDQLNGARTVKRSVDDKPDVRLKDSGPELRSLDPVKEIRKVQKDETGDRPKSKSAAFATEPFARSDHKPRPAPEIRTSKGADGRFANEPSRLRKKGLVPDRHFGERTLGAALPRTPRVEDRFERSREMALAARREQQRSQRAMSDLRVLDDRLEKVREAARAARQEMAMSDDMFGKRPESLYSSLDDRPAPKSKTRDPRFDVDRTFERKVKTKEKAVDEPARRKKSVIEQLDDRRKAALEKRREKKKQESKRR